MAFLDKAGLEQLWLNIVSKLGGKVDKVEGKGLSTNDYTTKEKEQLVTLTGLVGDTAVSTQISNAVSSITTESIGALKEEDYYGIIREEGGIVSAESLEGLAIGAVSNIVSLQSGTGDPSPDNVRPISGFDAVTLTRTGKNLLGFNDFSASASGVYTDTCVNGVFRREVISNHSTSFIVGSTGISSIINPHIPAGTYTFTLKCISGVTYPNPYMEVTLSDGSIVNLANGVATTLLLDGIITGVRMRMSGFSAGNTAEFTMQLEAGAGTEYEPYNGITLTADLPETIYGGILDWNTGLLTITHYKQTFDGTEDWETTTDVAFRLRNCLPTAIVMAENTKAYHISSHYKPSKWRAAAEQTDNTCYTLNGHSLMVKDTAKGTLDNFKSYLAEQAAAGTPFTIIHQMREKAYTTIQLTPQQLTAINGVNYVQSNCGNVCATFNYTPFLETVNNMLVNNGSEGQSLTLDSNKKLIWENAPWKNILDPSGDISFHLYASEGKSIVDSMKTMPLGLYTIYVQKGCPDNPPGAEAINSNLQGIMNINTDPTEQCYGWIILFDDESHCYTQYVQSGVGSGWTQLDQKIDPTLSIEGASAEAKTVGDAIAALNEHYGIIHKEGNIVVEESLEGLAIGAISDIKPTQAGTGDPTPDNIRPITGQNVAHIYRTGKNLSELGTITFGRSKQVNLSVPIPPGTYTMSAIITSNDTDSTYCNVHFYSGNAAHVKRLFSRSENGERVTQQPITFTKDITSIYFYASDGYANGTGDIATFADIQIEQNSVATDYEVYNGQKLTSTLPETIYGGTLDWATGLLTVTHRCLILDGTEDWNSNSSTNPGQFYMTLDDYSGDVHQGSYCSHYLTGNAYFPAIDKHIEVRGTSIWLYDTTIGSTTADLKTYLAAQAAAGTPVTLVYQLTTPYTIQLAPQQLTAINGDNYVWSDYGDIRANFNYTPFSGLVNTKVDKIEGMGLSTNDYTTTEKDKLAGIETGANRTIVDSELSSTSTNPVQNKIINTAINNLKSLIGDTAVSSQIAGAIADLINGAPTTLDTLGEIATAMEENADVVAALDTAIGTKANASDLTSHINDETNPHNVTLDQLNVSATVAELNFVSGTRSNIQVQFDELSVSITNDEIDAICGSTLELDSTLTDEMTGTTYALYVSDGNLKMTEVK